MAMPLISLANSLSGGTDAAGGTSLVVPPVVSTSPGVWLILGAFVLNQILLVVLIGKRRDFDNGQGQPRANAAQV